jgi:bidirectional [NiFe] hydrogenase diaphorase subunit
MISQKTAAQATQSLTLQIDGKDVSCRSGQTILQVARENGIEIPTLCYLEGLSTWGGCRLCMVEIAGSNKLAAACATACAEGMVVTTSVRFASRTGTANCRGRRRNSA